LKSLRDDRPDGAEVLSFWKILSWGQESQVLRHTGIQDQREAWAGLFAAGAEAPGACGCHEQECHTPHHHLSNAPGIATVAWVCDIQKHSSAIPAEGSGTAKPPSDSSRKPKDPNTSSTCLLFQQVPIHSVNLITTHSNLQIRIFKLDKLSDFLEVMQPTN
jgi:hypothetical protein